jgi:hypothetical protein
MPWKKGQSGNPLGRLPGEKQFADQLRVWNGNLGHFIGA